MNVRLGSVCKIVMGQAPPGNKCNKHGEGSIFVKAGEFGQRKPLVREWTVAPLKIAQLGDTLVCVVGATAGKVNEGIDAAIGRSVAAVRPERSQLEPLYLYHFMRIKELELRAKSQGMAQGVITKDMLEALSVPLPPLDEQKRIAAILDQAEELRAKRRAAIALLDQLPQAIFLEMFGDPATNPRDIETALLGDLCTRITDGTHQPPKFSDSGHPFLFVRNITSGEIDFTTEKFISDETYEELTRRCPIEQGDVIYSTVGSYGVPVVVRAKRRFAFQRHIAHLKPDNNRLLPEFLCGMLASPPLKRQADASARGVAQKTVNLADIRRYIVFAPSLSLQQEYVSRIEAIQCAKSAHQSALAKLEALFASLQTSVFSSQNS